MENMKKKKRYVSLKLSVFMILFSTSCTKDFEEINTNEYIFNEASPSALFTGVVKNTLDLVGGTMNDQGKAQAMQEALFLPLLMGSIVWMPLVPNSPILNTLERSFLSQVKGILEQ